jgi:hypothetical protein
MIANQEEMNEMKTTDMSDEENEFEIVISSKKNKSSKINLINNEYLNQCVQDAAIWNEQIGSYYRTIMCCRTIKKKGSNSIEIAFENIRPFCYNSLEEVNNSLESQLCVLPIGHTGTCSHNPHIKMFNGLKNKFDTGIYSTPGNDEYVFKNRASRLFPIALPDDFERRIKDKTKKLKCAIPLKDKSTPLMLASAYLDLLIYICNIRDISTIKREHDYWTLYQPLLTSHKLYLSNYFAEKNRTIFNTYGYTECCVTGYEFNINDFIRDCRTCPLESDVQLGHCLSRKDNRFTIRGLNICVMSREGNRLVGDNDFFSEEWLNRLRNVVSRIRLK